MDHIKHMKNILYWIVHLREVSLTYPRWFSYKDAKTGQRFDILSVAITANSTGICGTKRGRISHETC